MSKIKHSISLTPEETQKLNTLAIADERSRSSLIGRLIRQEYHRRKIVEQSPSNADDFMVGLERRLERKEGEAC